MDGMKFDVTTRKKMPSFSQGNNHITDVIDQVTNTFIMADVVVTGHSDHELMCGLWYHCGHFGH